MRDRGVEGETQALLSCELAEGQSRLAVAQLCLSLFISSTAHTHMWVLIWVTAIPRRKTVDAVHLAHRLDTKDFESEERFDYYIDFTYHSQVFYVSRVLRSSVSHALCKPPVRQGKFTQILPQGCTQLLLTERGHKACAGRGIGRQLCLSLIKADQLQDTRHLTSLGTPTTTPPPF